MSNVNEDIDLETLAILEDEEVMGSQDEDLISEDHDHDSDDDEEEIDEDDDDDYDDDDDLEDDEIMGDELYDDLIDEGDDMGSDDKAAKSSDKELQAVAKDDKAAKEEILSREDVSLYEPITFSEDAVRVVDRDGIKLISESDFESVFHHYQGNKSGEDIIVSIAESHGVDPDDIVIMLTEGEVGKPTSPVKKGIAKGGGISAGIKSQMARIRQQLSNLPPASPSAKMKKKELRRLRARLALHQESEMEIQESEEVVISPESDPDLL